MSLFTLISDFGLLSNPLPGADNILLFGVKAMFIIAGVIYLLFSVLVTRQIAIMSSTISTTASLRIKLLGFLHLAAALFVLIYFVTVL